MDENREANSRHNEKKLQREKGKEETLANLENGIFENYQFHSGNSDVWQDFFKIRKCETKEHVDFVQCIECKELLSFKEWSGTSHLMRHKCSKGRADKNDSTKFRSLPISKIAATRSSITDNIIKYCTSDFVKTDTICYSDNFLDMVQSFVLLGHKSGNINVKNVFPSSNHVNRIIGNIKDEKIQEISKNFRDSIKHGWCSATIEVKSCDNSTDHDAGKVVLMSLQYFENELTGLKRKVFLTIVLDKDDSPESFLLKLINEFNIIGGDKEDLQRLIIVTPNEELFSKALAFPFTRNNCVTDVISKILNEAFKECLTDGNDTLSISRDIVKYVNSMEKHNIKLSEDDGTWKSKLSMIRSIFEHSDDVVKILENEDLDLQFNKRKTEEVLSFLEPFVEAMDDLSTSSYTTTNKILLWWATLKDHLNSHDGSSFEIKRITARAKEIFDEKFKPTKDNQIDCFLHPRYKSLKMLSETERADVITEVRKLLEDIVDDVDRFEVGPSSYIPIKKKARFAKFEDRKEVKEKPKKKSRFSKFEANDEDLEEADEVDMYLKLPAIKSSNFQTEFDVIDKFWKPQKKKLPKLFKFMSIRLHVPAASGREGPKNFQLLQNLKPGTLNDYLLVRNNF